MRRYCWLVLIVVPLMLSPSSRAAEKTATAEEPIYQGKTLSEWIADLKDPKWENHPATIQALGVFGPRKEVVSALTACLESIYGEEIRQAAQTLGQFGPRARKALPALREAFKRLEDSLESSDKHPTWHSSEEARKIRRTIAEALILIEEHPGPDFAPILLEALKTDDLDKRRDIVVKLGKLGPDAARATVPALIALLEGTQKEWDRTASENELSKLHAIRSEAVISLGRIGPAAKPALHAMMMAMKLAVPKKEATAPARQPVQRFQLSRASSVSAIASTEIDSWYTAKYCIDLPMLRACLDALRRIRPESGPLGAVRLALRDLDEDVRWAALSALRESERDTSDIVSVLLPLLRDKNEAVRWIAVNVVGQAKSEAKSIVPALAAMLRDENAYVRASAARVLGSKGAAAKEAVPTLLDVIEDSAEQVRQDVAEALGKIGTADPKVIAALIAALEDKNEDVRGAAGEALTKFGARAKSAVPALIPFLQSENRNERGFGCVLLGRFGPVAKEAIPALEKIARADSEECLRPIARTVLARIDPSRLKETVADLSAMLQSQNEELRMVAVEALEFLGPDAQEALPALRRLRKRSGGSETSEINSAIEAIANPKKER